MARNLRPGPNWVTGTVVEMLGPDKTVHVGSVTLTTLPACSLALAVTTLLLISNVMVLNLLSVLAFLQFLVVIIVLFLFFVTLLLRAEEMWCNLFPVCGAFCSCLITYIYSGTPL